MISLCLTFLTLSNGVNQSVTNNTYLAIVNQYNTSQCNHSEANYSYYFNCSHHMNSTECCFQEYLNFNTTFGNSQCSQYELNDTYMSLDCKIHSSSSNKNWMEGKRYMYVIAGVAALLLLCLLMRCCCHRDRQNYNRV